MAFEVEITGDIAGLASLPKQLKFATAKALTDTSKLSQAKIIRYLKSTSDIVVRGDWYSPQKKFGIKVKSANRTKLESRVYSNAEWLLELHGYNGGIKRPEGISKAAGKVPGSLSMPNIGNARPNLRAIMPRSQKASVLRSNAKRNKVFVITSKKTGDRLLLQRVGLDTAGNILRGSRGQARIGRKNERAGTKVILKAVFKKAIRQKPNPFIFRETIVTYQSYLPHYFKRNLILALQSAK